ncbi:diguanylate cyclase domain-containing protein [Actinoplanes sp. NPDC049681]|uniref:diguanylate cyclase domain-containing protein n=1 Tax=Actinoplanes sp. NPDC049681 TaxID=3363905 RepID=UPI0037BABECA
MQAAGSGTVGGDYFRSAPIPENGWRVVFVAPEKVLLEPIQSTGRLAWEIFSGCALAVLCMAALGATTLARSARLAHERLHDALTGLPNRALFLERAARARAERCRHGGELAVLFIDLDGFKLINDAHGHATGDALLCAVARRLRERPAEATWSAVSAGTSSSCSARTWPASTRPSPWPGAWSPGSPGSPGSYEIQGRTVRVGSVVGVAVADAATTDPTGLIHSADQAMYEAKHGGPQPDRGVPPAARGRHRHLTGGGAGQQSGTASSTYGVPSRGPLVAPLL